MYVNIVKKEPDFTSILFDKSGSLPLPAPTGLSSLGMRVSFLLSLVLSPCLNGTGI